MPFDVFLDHVVGALFITALVNFPLRPDELGSRMLGLLPGLGLCLKWKHLGVSILLGIRFHLVFARFMG